MTMLHENIVGIDAAIFMHPTTWKASGHIDSFNDPMVDTKDSKKRYRADVLIENRAEEIRKEGKENNQKESQEIAQTLVQKMADFLTAENMEGLKNLLIEEKIKPDRLGT